MAVLQLRAEVRAGYVDCSLTFPDHGPPATGFINSIDHTVHAQLGLFEAESNDIRWSEQLDVTRFAACFAVPVENGERDDWLFACPTSVQIANAGEQAIAPVTDDHSTAIAAAGGRSVWTDLPSDGSPSRIVVFDAGKSPTQAGTLTGDACAVDVTPHGVAAVFGTGPSTAEYCQTTYETLRFAGIAENAQSEWDDPWISGPISSVPAAVEAFQSSGDHYVALLRDTVAGGTNDRSSWLVVGRAGDWAMQRIDPPNGGFFNRSSVALDGSFVYAVEVELGASNYYTFGRLYRFALASMDFVEPVR